MAIEQQEYAFVDASWRLKFIWGRCQFDNIDNGMKHQCMKSNKVVNIEKNFLYNTNGEFFWKHTIMIYAILNY